MNSQRNHLFANLQETNELLLRSSCNQWIRTEIMILLWIMSFYTCRNGLLGSMKKPTKSKINDLFVELCHLIYWKGCQLNPLRKSMNYLRNPLIRRRSMNRCEIYDFLQEANKSLRKFIKKIIPWANLWIIEEIDEFRRNQWMPREPNAFLEERHEFLRGSMNSSWKSLNSWRNHGSPRKSMNLWRNQWILIACVMLYMWLTDCSVLWTRTHRLHNFRIG